MTESKNDCVFCKIVKGEIPTKRIYENTNFIAFPDANPRVRGHSLVMPKKHVEDFLGLDKEYGESLVDAIKNTAKKVMKDNRAKGFNIINNNSRVAGQIVEHLHFHIIPRKEGDSVRVLG